MRKNLGYLGERRRSYVVCIMQAYTCACVLSRGSKAVAAALLDRVMNGASVRSRPWMLRAAAPRHRAALGVVTWARGFDMHGMCARRTSRLFLVGIKIAGSRNFMYVYIVTS